MSSNFERLHKIKNEAYAENFSILSQKLANPLLYLALHFLIGIPFFNFLAHKKMKKPTSEIHKPRQKKSCSKMCLTDQLYIKLGFELFSHVVQFYRIHGLFLSKKTRPIEIKLTHFTEVRFASFLSGGFTTMAVINPPARKLEKRTSFYLAKYFGIIEKPT